MNARMQVHSPESRLQARLAGELRARTVFLQLICIVSILRTVLTRIVPMAGSGAWWLTLVCLLPGAGVYGLLALGMRLTGSANVTDLARVCLGGLGGWLLSFVMAAATLLDGASSMTALITLFTEGVGTKGTQLTLAILTGAVLLTCLHREGLPRGAYLLRWVMLGAALLTAAFGLPAVRVDSLFPMLGDGKAALTAAFRAGLSLAWPFALLLTLPKEREKPRLAALCPVILSVLGVLVFLTLTNPNELLTCSHTLADSLLLPTRYASSAIRTLAQCLLMLVFFLAIGGAAQLSTDFLCAPMGQPPGWLPYAVLTLLTATQALQPGMLWEALGFLEPWLLLPVAVLAAACLPIAIIRRKRT